MVVPLRAIGDNYLTKKRFEIVSNTLTIRDHAFWLYLACLLAIGTA